MKRHGGWAVAGGLLALCLLGSARAGNPADEELGRYIKKGPRPPDRVGEQVTLPFPPPAPSSRRPIAPPAVAAVPLAIVLHQPEGSEQTPPAISVTFNQPMVPVSSVGEVSQGTPPLRVEPAIAGAFKWLGTTTLSLVPKARLRYATRYQVSVPAGASSVSKQALHSTFKFSFDTPLPQVAQCQPSNGSTEVGLDTPIILVFNQAVSAEKIAARVRLTAPSGRSIPLGAVPRADWPRDPRFQGYSQSQSAAFIAIFVPTAALTPNTSYRVDVQAGLISDEGPLPMAAPFTASFMTYPPLAVRNVGCGCSWSDTSASECEVGSNLCVSFNHALKIAGAEPYLTVTPRPKDTKLRVDSNSVTIDGKFLAETSYRVEVAAGVKDAYGQTLAKAWSATVPFKHLAPSLELLVSELALIEKGGRLELPLRVLNIDAVNVEAFLLPDGSVRDGLAALRHSIGSSDFEQAMLPIRSHRVARWQERIALPKDRPALYELSLKKLVREHGPGPYLLVIDKAAQAVMVQLTDLGLTARYDSDRMVVLATSIATGKPLGGVKVTLADGASPPATTGADGVAVLQATPHGDERSFDELTLFAALGKDRSFVRAASYGDDQRSTALNWGAQRHEDEQRTFLYPDRDLYRPGEEVHVYGIHRRYGGGIADRIGLVQNPAPVTWTARSSRNRELGKGSTGESGFGTFHFSFKIPAEVDLGGVTIETSIGSLGVQVQEYRAPEFEVAVRLPQRPVFFGEALNAEIGAHYLFGAPMRGADARWTLFSDPARFTAPNHDDFHFGSAPERWREYEYRGRFREGPARLTSGAGKLDAAGRLAVSAPLGGSIGQLDPATLILEAQVSDVSRQVVAGRASVLAHPSDRYVGVRLPPAVIEAGRPAGIELVLVDLDGNRIAGVPITVKAQSSYGEATAAVDDDGNAITTTTSKVVDVAPCTARSANSVQACALTFARGGTYLLEAGATDSKQRPIFTRAWVYVVGPDTVAKDTKAQHVELTPDRKIYQPGQTAQVALRTPFADGVVLLTEEHHGLVGHRVLKVANHSAVARIAIREELLPNLELTATAIAARDQGHEKSRPPAAWATGAVSLEIARDGKRLEVAVHPAKAIGRPGEKLAVDVTVTDAQHQAVAATVSLVAVDEAVLGMTGFATPDPLTFFHYLREPGVALAELLKLLLPEPGALEREAKKKGAPESRASMKEDSASGAGASAHAGGGGGLAAAVRRLFLTTPVAAVLVTGRDGKARFTLPLPDNLTRYRLMAVAADAGDRFGRGESAVRVQQPLQLRAALPRFANTSDAFLAAVLVDNQTGQPGNAEVTIQVEGLELVGPKTATVAVPPGEPREVAFQVKAPRPGPAKVRFSVRLGAESDAVEATLPVWTPATTEAFATYGSTTGVIAQPVAVPKDVLPGFGGLSIALASTALTGLQDAARYLIEYPYGCAEQVSSRAMPILVLGDLVEQFKIGGAETLAIQKKHAEAAVQKLIAGQHPDGGWGTWWSPSDESRADLTAYILLVLRRGREAGLPIPDGTVERASSWLTQWIDRQQLDQKDDGWRRRWILDVEATALYALGDWGQRHEARARALYSHERELDLFARALLAAVFHRLDAKSPERAALLRELENRAIQTPAAARFQEEQSEALQLLMHSSSRTDAIALLVLLETDRENALVPKIVRGLLDARVNGRWDNTQANAYALYALSRYFKIYEAEPTAFSTSMWLGKGFLGETRFEKRTMREALLEIPMSVVKAAGAADVTLGKSGPGRLYYRIAMNYAPSTLRLDALDQGFTVQRSYEAVAAPDDVRRDPGGGWQVKAGAYVRVHLQVVVQDRRFYVVVDDPLPAGLELVNTDFKTSARDALGDPGDAGWLGYWTSWRFNHQELRDERSLHFADQLEPGVYHLTAIARATTRGTFLVPPTRSEEMYRPEVFGRAASDRMTIK